MPKAIFYNRPYNGFSVVSTGLKSTLEARCFRRQFPNMDHYEVYSVRAHLTAHFHPYLVIYTYDLGVRRLPFIPDSGGSTVSYAHVTSSSH